MRFRPSYYSKVQLTTYAPNGGYPGFYGADDAPAEAPSAEEQKAKAEEDFSLAKTLCGSTFDPESENPLVQLGYNTCVTEAKKLFDAAMKKAEDAIVAGLTPTTGGGTTTPPKSGGGGGRKPPGTTNKNVPAHLTASEKALIDACMKKPMRVRYGCMNQAIAKIKADREAAKKETKEGSNTVWWVLGGAVVAGGVYLLWKRS